MSGVGTVEIRILRKIVNAGRFLEENVMSNKVFIAHAEADTDVEIVAQLKHVLCQWLPCSTSEVFSSSDHESIKSYEDFPDAIKKAVRNASAVMVVLTPNSVSRPWVHFEAGGAYFGSNKNRLFVVTALGIGPDSLPSNLLFKSVRDLGREADVRQLIADLRQTLGYSGTPPIGEPSLARLVDIAGKGLRGWNLVEPAGVATKTSGSPLELLGLLRRTQSLAFIAGQNIYTLTKGKLAGKADAAIFKFLSSGDKKGMVQILLQDPRCDAGRKVWTSIQSDFAMDLDESVEELRKWRHRAETEGINDNKARRLDVRVTSLVPVSFSFFDPDATHGIMVCTPVLWRGAQSELRPAFLLTGGKMNPVLAYYWDIWELHFKASKRLE